MRNLTFLEMYAVEHPDEAVLKRGHGKGFGCPENYGYEEHSSCCGGCDRCWGREVPIKSAK